MTECQPNAAGSPSTEAKLAAVRAALQERGKPHEVLRETSMAWVFLTRDRVYKMKKPIRRRIFDFRSLDQRHYACAEELRLNRRLAPDVYLGLSRLTRAPDGSLALDGPGETVEWLVRMRRLTEPRFLDHAIASGYVTEADIAAVAECLAGFHAAARLATTPSDAYLGRYRDEVTAIRGLLAEGPFGDFAGTFTKLLDLLETTLDRDPGLMLTRLAKGRIVDGHGDLRPEHVWLGLPVLIIDCLEAAPEFRMLDPFEEYAMLAMECAVLGAEWIGKSLLDRAAWILGDWPDDRLIAFYTVFRATLRARQALAHLMDPTPRTPEKWRPQAERYLGKALRDAAILESAIAPSVTRPN